MVGREFIVQFSLPVVPVYSHFFLQSSVGPVREGAFKDPSRTKGWDEHKPLLFSIRCLGGLPNHDLRMNNVK